MYKEIFKKYETYFSEEIFAFFKESLENNIHTDHFTCTQTIQPYKIRQKSYYGFDIKPEDIIRTEMSKKWFNEFIEPLQEKGFWIRKLP